MKKLNSSNSNKQRGFTIIEVMIVLAVAGLILGIVFFAIAGTNRSSRDHERKEISGKLVPVIMQYGVDHEGDISGFTCASGCDSLKDPDTNSQPREGALGDKATDSSGVLYVFSAACGNGSSDGMAVDGAAGTFAILYWLEGSSSSHCVSGGTPIASAGSTAGTAGADGGSGADGSGTGGSDTGTGTGGSAAGGGSTLTPAQERDKARIAKLQEIHTQLINYVAAHGYLPYTGEYNEMNPGGWDYSSQGGFMTFLSPSPISPAPNDGVGDNLYCSQAGKQTYAPFEACNGYSLAYFCYMPSVGWAVNGTTLAANLEDPAYYAGNSHVVRGSYYEMDQQNIGRCGAPPAASINGASQQGCVTLEPQAPGFWCQTSGTSFYSCGNFSSNFSTTGVNAGSNWLTLNYEDHNCQGAWADGGVTTPPSALYKFNINIYVNGTQVASGLQLDPAGGTTVINLGVTPANPTIKIEWDNNYWVTDNPSDPYKYDPDFQINSIGVGP